MKRRRKTLSLLISNAHKDVAQLRAFMGEAAKVATLTMPANPSGYTPEQPHSATLYARESSGKTLKEHNK